MNGTHEFGQLDCGVEVRRRLDRHIIEYTKPAAPNLNRYQGGAGDGPLLGNGDLGAIIVGTPDRLVAHFGTLTTRQKEEYHEAKLRRGGLHLAVVSP